jgi:hypothetical protein
VLATTADKAEGTAATVTTLVAAGLFAAVSLLLTMQPLNAGSPEIPPPGAELAPELAPEPAADGAAGDPAALRATPYEPGPAGELSPGRSDAAPQVAPASPPDAAEAAQEQPAASQPAQVEPVHPEPARPERVQSGRVQSGRGQSRRGQSGRVQSESGQSGRGQSESGQSGRGQSEPVQPRLLRPARPASDAGRRERSYRATVPQQLPERQRLFRGRVGELRRLTDEYERLRATDPSHPGMHWSTGPVLLPIHGKTGVGKSALAQELAHRLAGEHPDGTLYANLSQAGGSRPPGEVLKSFLEALGWRDIPPETDDRVKIFRSLTAKSRILVVLDAARGADQVQQILPSGSGCTVIITSRPDLGPQLETRSLGLGVLSTADSCQVLDAYSRRHHLDAPTCAVEVAELCGRLPFALRSAGEQAARLPGGLCEVAARLRPPKSRLRQLAYNGRDIEGRIAAEYELLVPREQYAFRLLALVPSSSFVPWVLGPLLDVDFPEAENIVARLSGRELLDVDGPDDLSGLARYRFHPLVRLYAQQKLAEHENRADSAAALSRLDAAYLEAADKVLRQLDRSFPGRKRSPDHTWFPAGPLWPQRIAQLPFYWVRAEHANLVRTVHAAHAAQEWGIAWRVAARLGACLPPDVDVASGLLALDEGLLAAQVEGADLGRAEVLLARGAFLGALDRHGEATEALNQADEAAAKLARGNGDRGGLRLAAAIHRTRAETLLQQADYQEARVAAALATQRATEASVEDSEAEVEELLARLVTADAEGVLDPERSLIEGPFSDALVIERDDGSTFRGYLGLSEVARRRRNWAGATEHLQNAGKRHDGDARRLAMVQYKLAKTSWHECRAAEGQERVERAERSVMYAAQALLTFQNLHNLAGMVRARCMLCRALVAAGRAAQAEVEAKIAQRHLNELAGEEGVAPPLLACRVQRVQGEVLLEAGSSLARAQALLADAERGFAESGDWWSCAETKVLLGRTLARQDRYGQAYAAFWVAAAAFDAGQDEVSRNLAYQEIAGVAERMGLPGMAADMRGLGGR